MLNSNLAYNSKEYSWNLPEWSYLVDEVSKVFRLTHSEKERLNNSKHFPTPLGNVILFSFFFFKLEYRKREPS